MYIAAAESTTLIRYTVESVHFIFMVDNCVSGWNNTMKLSTQKPTDRRTSARQIWGIEIVLEFMSLPETAIAATWRVCGAYDDV